MSCCESDCLILMPSDWAMERISLSDLRRSSSSSVICIKNSLKTRSTVNGAAVTVLFSSKIIYVLGIIPSALTYIIMYA